jgi:hypothetical protein
MEQTIRKEMVMRNVQIEKGKPIAFAFAMKGRGRLIDIFSSMKKIYRNNIIHDFHSIWTARLN